MNTLHKLFMFFGADIKNYGLRVLEDSYLDGYTLMPLDSSAIGYINNVHLPFTLIDDYIGTESFIHARKLAFDYEENWFKSVQDYFTLNSVCWPELDRDAMFWFWRNTLLTFKIAEAFVEKNGNKIKYFQNAVLRPSLYYYRSDTHAVVLNQLLKEKTVPIVTTSTRKYSYEYGFTDGSILFDNYTHTMNIFDYSILSNKIVLAINQGEFHRFKIVIDHLSKSFQNKLAVVIIYPNSKLAKELSVKYSIPVICPNMPDIVRIKKHEQFHNGFHKLIKNFDGRFLGNLLNILRYHFECHYIYRWPILSNNLTSWNKLWAQYRPKAVIVSNLTDCESQLPAAAANQNKIPTFSIPHGAWGVNKSKGISKYVLYNSPLQKSIYKWKGTPSDSLKKCRNIIEINEYPVVNTKKVFSPKKNWRVLALIDPVYIEGNLNTFIEPRAQIKALQILDNQPPDIINKLSMKIKVHPGYPNIEIPALISKSLANKVLPSNSELQPIAKEANLVIAVNYTGAALIHVLHLGKPVVFLWTDRLVGASEKCDMGYILSCSLQSGILVRDSNKLWDIVRNFFTSSIINQQMYLKAKTFGKKYLDNRDYPNISEILNQVIPNAIDICVCDNKIRPLNLKNQEYIIHTSCSKSIEQTRTKYYRNTLNSNQLFPRIQNIDADPDFYYGEIPKDHFIQLLQTFKQNDNIESVISDYCKRNQNKYFKEYALDNRRALGLRLLGNLHDKRVLDYGCGLGSLGISASRYGAAHVTFVDSCLLRLQAAYARAKQHNLTDTQFLACKSWESLSSDINTYDVIILNGILEWVAATSGSNFKTVIKTQLDFLLKMQKFLKPEGTIFLAIENRFALQYFMGYPEDHTDIPYLSIMPRESANNLHLTIKGTEYLAWTWSLQDYYSMLPMVNLKLTDAYAMFPDYRFPRLIVSLDDIAGLKKGMLMEKNSSSNEIRKRFIDYIAEMKLIKHFVYSYSLLLKKCL